VGETAHEFFKALGARDHLLHFEDFAGGEFLPARADGSGFADAAQEDADFVEGEAHFSSEANEKDAVEGFFGIAALAARTDRSGQEFDFFVLADGGSVEAGVFCEFTDFHLYLRRTIRGPASIKTKS
jgi:hypothetical protein